MVFVEKSAEQVVSMHLAWLAVADDAPIGGWIRRFQSERSVRTMGVVVGGVDPQDLLQMPRPMLSSQSRHSVPTVRTQRSA
jgi:hypothetical protein